MVDRMDSRRPWLVQPKRLGDKPRAIATLDAVEEWTRLGYTVDGPFVPEARHAGAVEAERWLAWLDSNRNNDGDVPLKGTPYQAAQRIAKRLHDYERGQ
jgi:hypothetical protein